MTAGRPNRGVPDIRALARKSCYDQIAYTDRAGVRHAERVTAEAVKEALLACGTAGRFVIYTARTGVPLAMNWRIGLNILGQFRRGWYTHG